MATAKGATPTDTGTRGDQDPLAQQTRHHVAWLSVPPHVRKHSNDELQKIVRLLAVASSDDERAIVIYHLLHRLRIDKAGERLRLPMARAVEILNSCTARLGKVELRVSNEAKLAHFQKVDRRNVQAQAIREQRAKDRVERPDVPSPEDRTCRFD